LGRRTAYAVASEQGPEVGKRTILNSEALAQLFYRNAANFVRLAPGVTGQSQGTYTSDNQTSISINGGGGFRAANEWVLDVMPDTIPLSAVPSSWCLRWTRLREMKVNATMLDASLGHMTGGAVVTVTKAGTNKVHGTLYGFGRWKGLNANSWSNDLNHVPRPDVNYYQTGYFLGGPVVIPHLYDRRNRPFFASAYERDNDVRDLSETTRVPTAAETHGDLNPFPNGITQPVGTASGTLTQMGSSISFVNPNRVVPYSQQWQFSVQQGLPKGRICRWPMSECLA
jgi:hypothetical protein